MTFSFQNLLLYFGDSSLLIIVSKDSHIENLYTVAQPTG